MNEEQMQIFVDIVSNFFNQFNEAEVIVDTPYLLEKNKSSLLEYTGIITISGSHSGVVYVTATKGLLVKTLDSMGETSVTQENIIDLVGEIANTISGNARQEFGSEFHISVPSVLEGTANTNSIVLPKDKRSFVIPIEWHSQIGEIVICVQTQIDAL